MIVISWQRPAALRRCIRSLAQQDLPLLELCIVADADALDLVRSDLDQTGYAAKLTLNPGGNVSVARNIGLDLASGEIVAFIDDDAAAEPGWARQLAGALVRPGVIAATGYTRGRNGISFQWTACDVDATGQDLPLPDLPDPAGGITFHTGTPQRALKPVGTNCAFRRSALIRIGGFDPAYHFYLEDADIALRLAPLGQTAVVPLAQVHHGFAPSARRRADRVPLSLSDIGASSMIFLRRHAPETDWPAALSRLRREQRLRMLRHMIAGRIGPPAVRAVLATLETGITEGALRALPAPQLPPPADTAFLPLGHPGARPGRVIAGRIWQRRQLRAAAKRAVAAGEIVTVFELSPTALRHRMEYTSEGYWLQCGGIFGAAARHEPAIQLWRFGTRVQELGRFWANLRPFTSC